MSVTAASVVRNMAATDEAFSKAERVTFFGSMMPALNISTSWASILALMGDVAS